MIWLPELIEPAANFRSFFDTPRSKILANRNVWLLDYRNQGESDHHHSYDMWDMSDDIIRFMNDNQISLATIGGHGYGAKVAAATAINHMDRFTGLIQYEGGPLNHKYYEAYHELSDNIKFANSLNLNDHDVNSAFKAIDDNITCKKWAAIFKQVINDEGQSLKWNVNIAAMCADVSKSTSWTANWPHSYGLWPGQTLAIFAAHSKWVHLSTNTLAFYNVMPRLQNEFPQKITTWAENLEGPATHWMHNEPEADPQLLQARMARWLRFHDGVNVLLSDRNEVGNTFIPERGLCPNAGVPGEAIPEHVHHNYMYTDAYELSRERRGKEAA